MDYLKDSLNEEMMSLKTANKNKLEIQSIEQKEQIENLTKWHCEQQERLKVDRDSVVESLQNQMKSLQSSGDHMYSKHQRMYIEYEN